MIKKKKKNADRQTNRQTGESGKAENQPSAQEKESTKLTKFGI